MGALTPEVIAAAQEAQRQTGCLASIALAQWALESGWGKYTMGACNPFGMKWYPGCKYPFVVQHTKECEKGKWINIEAKFQHFPDMATAFIEHGKLLMNPKGPYRSALPFANDYRKFVKGIAHIYATDPNYEQLILKIIAGSKLDKYDLKR